MSRCKTVSVSADLLLEMFTTGNQLRLDIIEGVPPTAKLKGVNVFFEKEITMVIEDESFPELKENEIPLGIEVVIKDKR